jgi:hypothetical protein
MGELRRVHGSGGAQPRVRTKGGQRDQRAAEAAARGAEKGDAEMSLSQKPRAIPGTDGSACKLVNLNVGASCLMTRTQNL